LALEPNALKHTIFVPQGEITELFKGAPRERRKILNRLLGLDEFSRKYEVLNQKTKLLKNLSKSLEGKLEQGEKLKQLQQVGLE
jgi:exonuclease SbcC